MSAGEKSFRQQIFFSDANLFTMFNIPLTDGSKDKALELKNSIVIGKELARKFFGNDDPVGKTLRVNEKMDFIVSAVIGEIPSNSIFQIQAIMPLVNINELFYPGADAGWNDHGATTFLKTKMNEPEITSQLSAVVQKECSQRLSARGTGFLRRTDSRYLSEPKWLRLRNAGVQSYLSSVLIITFWS